MSEYGNKIKKTFNKITIMKKYLNEIIYAIVIIALILILASCKKDEQITVNCHTLNGTFEMVERNPSFMNVSPFAITYQQGDTNILVSFEAEIKESSGIPYREITITETKNFHQKVINVLNLYQSDTLRYKFTSRISGVPIFENDFYNIYRLY